jgi:hypothetical protein
VSATPLEKAVEQAQAALTTKDHYYTDADSWDIFVGNQMQTILDAAAHLHDARADALGIEALMAWAEEREREVRADSDWPFSGAYANAFRDEFIPKLRAILAEQKS